MSPHVEEYVRNASYKTAQIYCFEGMAYPVWTDSEKAIDVQDCFAAFFVHQVDDYS